MLEFTPLQGRRKVWKSSVSPGWNRVNWSTVPWHTRHTQGRQACPITPFNNFHLSMLIFRQKRFQLCTPDRKFNNLYYHITHQLDKINTFKLLYSTSELQYWHSYVKNLQGSAKNWHDSDLANDRSLLIRQKDFLHVYYISCGRVIAILLASAKCRKSFSFW